MQLFYNSEININDDDLIMSDSEHYHLTKVLRKKIDDKVYLTNGNGYLFEAIINKINTKSTQLKIINSNKKSAMEYGLHIGIAPTKKIDRFEWFLEKAIEIGVSSITPLICKYNERKSLNYTRLNKIAVSAMKQSLQIYLPKIEPIVSIKEFIESNQYKQKYIAHCKNSKKVHLSKIIKRKTNSSIIIGPEGGFTDDEISLAMDYNFIPVSLGSNRLRTETAGIVCCQTFSDVNNK
ncbi:MAG: 16S rRNA (uracil(1498)-N(3))-methyltransferase [Flavobacteriaceae bacterium]|jgi:16S rRNA (uracil1498-N3)-methyltransferase|nr:16S rRNA (uracil(1498)-N(3))-methyltransferase [Flavobacteriaceae bacterium]MBT4112554.1 16S rRNA (uracil(1498)-N(3))-methyltransferase [Flavobacteriaceae bacterium]MBT4614408.1 16S rRNA (uracil(1498)-N(3))-methyltransferase [Flavobacteriaceae bacterium]MBT5246861.1 16S rRNA (uracil(1498)-N(3))-methyltransferase [Flavobacteriaceae bacterium]MBT5650046.1 16S rRNA (uracil(1498)-N(3))-methyltransferase [Flavobacteriaceae bacterium]